MAPSQQGPHWSWEMLCVWGAELWMSCRAPELPGNTQTRCHTPRTCFPFPGVTGLCPEGSGLVEVTVGPLWAGCPRGLCSCWHRDKGTPQERGSAKGKAADSAVPAQPGPAGWVLCCVGLSQARLTRSVLSWHRAAGAFDGVPGVPPPPGVGMGSHPGEVP